MKLYELYPVLKDGVDTLFTQRDSSLEQYLTELGQIAQVNARINGNKKFTNQECFKGFALSIFSSPTKWSTIKQNLDLLNCLFFNVDISELARYSRQEIFEVSEQLVNAGIKQYINKKLDFIFGFCKTINNYKSDGTELFNEYNKLYADGTINDKLNLINRLMKIRGLGIPLAAEYMKNIGFDIAKPDRHIMRILSKDRLNQGAWRTKNSNEEYTKCELFSAIEIISDTASNLKILNTEIDNVLWLYCAKDYCEICESKPQCDRCSDKLRDNCFYNKYSTHNATQLNNRKVSTRRNRMKKSNEFMGSISSSGTGYNRLKIYEPYQNLFEPGRTYNVHFGNESVQGSFSEGYFEMDNNSFQRWSNNTLSYVAIDPGPLRNRIVKIICITPQ